MDLISARGFVDIAAARRRMSWPLSRRIVWLNVITVISAAILIGAEVFGAAFAGSWALATLFDLGGIGAAHPRRPVRALRHRHHGAVHPQRAPHRAVHRARLSARAPTHVAELRKS